MKLTGKERSSIQLEEKGEPIFYSLYHLLNTGIRGIIVENLKQVKEIEKYITQFITIGDFKAEKGTKVNMNFLISLEEDFYEIYKQKFSAYTNDLNVADIYNNIVDLYEDYAYELDTDIDNIKIELIEIELSK